MKHPCVFTTPFMIEQVYPRLYEDDPAFPFSALIRLWRKEHCATINPYGSESCPYPAEDCAIAFMLAAQQSALAKTSRVGLFKSIARSTGLTRAENKPLARDAIIRTDGQQNRPSGLRGGPGTGSADGVLADRQPRIGRAGQVPPGVPGGRSMGVRGSSHRPQALGDLLRGDGEGSRTQPYRRYEGEASPDHDGDARDPVPPPPPRWLGDQPPPGDPDLHQGGE